MRHFLLPFFFVLGAIAACSSSSSSGAAYDCNGGFPAAGDACPTEGQTCEDEGPPCANGQPAPGTDGALVYTCRGGQLVVSNTPQCISDSDASFGDGSSGNDATDLGDSASIDDAGDDAAD